MTPTLSPFLLPITDQQELFSLAYLYAVAAAAGYGVEAPRIDRGSNDVDIKQYGDDKNNIYPVFDTLTVQVKCTYAHLPQNGVLKYPLPIKNYNDLRPLHVTPRMLVVVHVPRPPTAWLIHEDTNMLLHHTAYWVSLRGKGTTDNIDSITISVPTSQRFTVDSLKAIMDGIAQGARP